MEVKRKKMNHVRTRLLILTNNENKKNMLVTNTKINSVSIIEFEKRCNDIVINLAQQFFKPDTSSKFIFSSKTNLIDVRKFTSNNNSSSSNTPKTSQISDQVFNEFLNTLHSKSSLAYKKLLYFENKYILNSKRNEAQNSNNCTYNHLKSPKLKLNNKSFEGLFLSSPNFRKKHRNEMVIIDNVLNYINRDKDFMNDKITKRRIRKGFQYLRGLATKLKLTKDEKLKTYESSNNNDNKTLFNKMTQILMLKENIDFDETSFKRSKSCSKGLFISSLPKITKKPQLSSQKSIDHIVLKTSQNQCSLILEPKSKFSFSIQEKKEEDLKEISHHEFYSTTTQTIDKFNTKKQNKILNEYSDLPIKTLNDCSIMNDNKNIRKDILTKEYIMERITQNKPTINIINTSLCSISSNNSVNCSGSISSSSLNSYLSISNESEISNSKISECTEVIFTNSSYHSCKGKTNFNQIKKERSNNLIF